MSPNPHTDVTEVALSPPGGGGGRNSEGSDGSIGYTGNFGHTNDSSNNSGRNVRRFPFLFYCFCFILSFLVLYCIIGFSEFFFLSHRELQALPHRSSVPCSGRGTDRCPHRLHAPASPRSWAVRYWRALPCPCCTVPSVPVSCAYSMPHSRADGAGTSRTPYRFLPPGPTSVYQILYLLWDEKTFLQNKKMIFFHKVICFILIIFRQLSVCATKVKFYFFTTVSRQDTIIQNIYIIFNRKHNSNAQTIIAQMKKKITKTLLIEPEDEKIEMVNNVIHQSIEELLVPYEKRRTYLPRKPPKWWK